MRSVEDLSLEELLQKCKEIGKNVANQDNRMTSYPVVQVKDDIGGSEKVVTVFFTVKAAEDFIKQNLHNLNDPFCYIASGYNNEEWKMIRELLIRLASGV